MHFGFPVPNPNVVVFQNWDTLEKEDQKEAMEEASPAAGAVGTEGRAPEKVIKAWKRTSNYLKGLGRGGRCLAPSARSGWP